MAQEITYVSDVPGDEGTNVGRISFPIPGQDGNTYRITLDASTDVGERIEAGVNKAQEAYVKALHRELKWLTTLAADESCAVKITMVKPTEKSEGSYSGDRAVNNAIRTWHNAREGVKPLSPRGRISDEVKTDFWTAVANGEVPDPRKGADGDQHYENDQKSE